MSALLAPAVALAESWALPARQSYLSADQRVRLTVTPRALASPLAYFQDKVAGKAPAGQLPGSPDTKARGVLERLDRQGRWAVVWEKALVNDVAPTNAIVADGGRYVVTFDNWHFIGEGNDVVVVYGGDGSVIRSLSLSDLLPPFYIKALPRSVSSILWSGQHRMSGKTLILQMVVPAQGQPAEKREYVELSVDLATGKPVPPSGPAWEKALAQAQWAVAVQELADKARSDALAAPLLGPLGNDEREWHDYLEEAFRRLDPDWKDGFADTQVLREPAAADYKASETGLRDVLLEKDIPAGTVMIASPGSPDNLVAVLTNVVRGMRPGALKAARIYVAVPPAFRDRVAAALAPTGAKFIHVDPETPIEQRAERLGG